MQLLPLVWLPPQKSLLPGSDYEDAPLLGPTWARPVLNPVGAPEVQAGLQGPGRQQARWGPGVEACCRGPWGSENGPLLRPSPKSALSGSTDQMTPRSLAAAQGVSKGAPMHPRGTPQTRGLEAPRAWRQALSEVGRSFPWGWALFSIFIYIFTMLFIFRDRRREGEREGENTGASVKHPSVASRTPAPGPWPTTQARALTGFEPAPFGSQASAQSTEPHQPGPECFFFL